MVSNELCYATTADVDVEYVPNVRRAPTHRVDLTRPERRSITVRAPRRRATAHFPFVDSDPFSHNYTSSPYVGANSDDEEKASNESDVEDQDGERSEEDIARVNYARINVSEGLIILRTQHC